MKGGAGSVADSAAAAQADGHRRDGLYRVQHPVRILTGQYHSTQYVAASLELFGSVVLLFWYILRLFMSRD